jgi:hypothetical protein
MFKFPIGMTRRQHALESAAAAAEGNTSSVISALESIQSKVHKPPQFSFH